MDFTIRRADLSDLPNIVLAGKEFYEFANLEGHGLRYNPSRFAEFSVWLMQNPVTCFFIGEIDGKFAGTIGGLLCPWFLDSSQLTATEQFWWVKPEFRGSRLWKDLLATFENWAHEKGASHIIMVSLINDREKALSRVYRTLSYNPVETHYVRRF